MYCKAHSELCCDVYCGHRITWHVAHSLEPLEEKVCKTAVCRGSRLEAGVYAPIYHISFSVTPSNICTQTYMNTRTYRTPKHTSDLFSPFSRLYMYQNTKFQLHKTVQHKYTLKVSCKDHQSQCEFREQDYPDSSCCCTIHQFSLRESRGLGSIRQVRCYCCPVSHCFLINFPSIFDSHFRRSYRLKLYSTYPCSFFYFFNRMIKAQGHFFPSVIALAYQRKMQMGLILIPRRYRLLKHSLFLQTSTGCSHQATEPPQSRLISSQSERDKENCWELHQFCFQFIDRPYASHFFYIPIPSVVKTGLMKSTSIWYFGTHTPKPLDAHHRPFVFMRTPCCPVKSEYQGLLLHSFLLKSFTKTYRSYIPSKHPVGSFRVDFLSSTRFVLCYYFTLMLLLSHANQQENTDS